MAWLADTLQIALVECQVTVSAVRDDVVHYRGGNYPTHCGAIATQRLGPELLESHTLPACGVIDPAAGRHCSTTSSLAFARSIYSRAA